MEHKYPYCYSQKPKISNCPKSIESSPEPTFLPHLNIILPNTRYFNGSLFISGSPTNTL